MSLKWLSYAGMLAASAAVLLASDLPASSQPMPTHTPTTAPYTSKVGAHARYSKARVNMGQPNLALTAAVVAAGGGPTSFDAVKLLAVLTGNGPLTQTETASLTNKFGADNVASFVKTFDFVMTDALAQARAAGIALPATPMPDPTDGKALAEALYTAGIASRGAFDVEYMLDGLVSHLIHVTVMNDIDADADLGPKADANYHAVLTQVMLDLKRAYELV